MELKEGIVLKAVAYRENSKLITVLTAEGLWSLLLRGALNQKSKTYAYSQEITKIALGYAARNEQDLKILTAGSVLNNYSAIKSDFDKLNDAIILTEATALLGEHIEDTDTFYRFASDILNALNNDIYNPYYLIIFKLKLLYLLGVGPVFTTCVNCGSRIGLVGFDFNSAGMKCRQCALTGDSFVQKDIIKICAYLYVTKLPNIDKNILASFPERGFVNEFINRYYEHYLGYNSKAEKVIKKIR